MNFRVVIPARYASTRLPGKVLLPIAGRPMLAHVIDRARESGTEDIWVATDDARVYAAAEAAGARAAMTAADHAAGSDRLAELVARLEWPDDAIVVNLQGDEPLMPGSLIAQVASALAGAPDADIATACVPIHDAAEFENPNVVKVVRDQAGRALYFSRAPIPHRRDSVDGPPPAFRHLGIYAYRVGALARFAAAPAGDLERCESLEQLRALAMGMRLLVVESEQTPGPGVDTAEDLARVVARLQPD